MERQAHAGHEWRALMTPEEKAQVIEGIAKLMRAIGTIGRGTDHDLAKIVVDGELELRALYKFAIDELASSLS
jgi:hypothetical protein